MRIALGGLLGLAIVGWLVSASLPASADGVFYYRGYFSAKAAEIPLEGFVYQIDPNTIQPAFYYQYRTQQVPLGPQAGARPGAGNGGEVRAPFMPAGPTVLASPVPIPGQYWYSEPGVYAFHTNDLGWPYGNRP